MSHLISPPLKYINRIENSWMFLNCPKHMYNYHLDCLYRQGIVMGEKTAIQFVSDYLKEFGTANPIETATKFVKWRETISISEFDNINVNSYIEKTPLHIDRKNEEISRWTEANTTYYSAIYGGGVKNIPTYVFSKQL